MRDVRRIEHDAALPVGDDARPASPRSTPAVSRPPLFTIEVAGERITAYHPSLPPPARKALRRGDTPPERTVDLHGARAADAVHRVERFVAEALHAGARCVCVITGRGLRSGPDGPVLRDRVVRILTETALAENVLGVVSAPNAFGGTGALLVLLRRQAPLR